MSSNNVEQPKITTVKLTKKGLPDKRGQTSAQNLAKGKSIIKEALKIAKEKKPKLEVIYSSDEYSTDEEIELKEVNIKKDPIPSLERKDTHIYDPLPNITKDTDNTFTFEKKLEEKIKELNDMYGIKISNIENDTKLTKAELNTLKLQNQALKKSMSNNFRTHAGIINEEMYLKF